MQAFQLQKKAVGLSELDSGVVSLPCLFVVLIELSTGTFMKVRDCIIGTDCFWIEPL